MTENFLKYETSSVASTSIFWWVRVCKKCFGACIGNSMANIYTFNNGLSIFVSDTTINSVYKDALKYPNTTLARCKALLDFVHVEKSHTGDNIGNWLHAIHKGVGCKLAIIGSHVVNSAYNAGKSVKVL